MIIRYKAEKIKLFEGKNTHDTFGVFAYTSGHERSEKDPKYFKFQNINFRLIVPKELTDAVGVLLEAHDYLIYHQKYGSGPGVELDESGQYEPKISISAFLDQIQFGAQRKEEGEQKAEPRRRSKVRRKPRKAKSYELDEPESADYEEEGEEDEIPF